jgi:hypothetical protein
MGHNVQVLAGDFRKGNGDIRKDLASVEIATEETVRRAWKTASLGAAGLVWLGPAGLLAGLLLGGRDKDVTFVAIFTDGRKLLGKTERRRARATRRYWRARSSRAPSWLTCWTRLSRQ